MSWLQVEVAGLCNKSAVLSEEASNLVEELIKQLTSRVDVRGLVEASEAVLEVMEAPVFDLGVLVEVVLPHLGLVSDVS